MFVKLPPDVIRILFEHLDPVEVFLLRCVCRYLHGLVTGVYMRAARGQQYLHAARNGYVRRLWWLRDEQRVPINDYARLTLYLAAAESGCILAFAWVIAQCGRRVPVGCYEIAAARGHVNILEYLFEGVGVFPPDPHITQRAASLGRVEVLEWAQQKALTARARKRPRRVQAPPPAASNDDTRSDEDEQGLTFDESTCEAAAAGGQLQALQWLRTNECPWDERVPAAAAQAGALELLRWATNQGCPWDERTCEQAIHHRKLDVLRWARENGAPWTRWLRRRARDELGYTDQLDGRG